MSTPALDPIVGIDLGTSNSVVAYCGEGGNVRVITDPAGNKVHPSVVSFHPNGAIVVGAAAKQRRIVDPTNTVYSSKRLIGRAYNSPEVAAARTRMPYRIIEGAGNAPMIETRAGQFAVPEISAMVIDHVRDIAATALEAGVNRAVITVPANFNDAQRSATATAGAIAGVTVVRVLNEPTAAALAYGHSRPMQEIFAVYDFGGGTFDVTVLRLRDQVYEVLGTAGNSFLGGDDLDECLVEMMVDNFLREVQVDLRTNEVAMMRLRAVAEQAKIELSRRTRAIIRIDEVAYGPKGVPLHLNMELTRDEFVAKCTPFIDESFSVCQQALKNAGLTPAQIGEVILVGGTTKMPYVRDRVARFFGQGPRTDTNPEEAVAMGAALQAVALQRILSRPRTTTGSLRITPVSTPVATPVPAAATQPGIPAAPAVPSRAPTAAPAPAKKAPVGPRTQAMPAVTVLPAVVRAPTAAPAAVAAKDPHASSTARLPLDGAKSLDDDPFSLSFGDSFGDSFDDTLGRSIDELNAAFDAGSEITNAQDLQSYADEMIAVEVDVPEPATDFDIEVPTTPALLTLEPPPTQQGVGRAPLAASIPARAPSAPSQAAPGQVAPSQVAPRQAAPSQVAPSKAPATLPGSAAAPARAATAAPPRGAAPNSGPGDTFRAMPPPIARGVAGTTQPPPFAAAGAALAPRAPAVAPVIQDIVPHSFGIATVAGYCEELIARNTRFPTEAKRTFSTSRDFQDTVRIQICQGQSRRLDGNTVVGDLVLGGLPKRIRGETTIEVTFAVDVSGMLRVRAIDTASGREQRANIDIIGGMSSDEVNASRARMSAMLGE